MLETNINNINNNNQYNEEDKVDLNGFFYQVSYFLLYFIIMNSKLITFSIYTILIIKDFTNAYYSDFKSLHNTITMLDICQKYWNQRSELVLYYFPMLTCPNDLSSSLLVMQDKIT
jgi:hypothetical protein